VVDGPLGAVAAASGRPAAAPARAHRAVGALFVGVFDDALPEEFAEHRRVSRLAPIAAPRRAGLMRPEGLLERRDVDGARVPLVAAAAGRGLLRRQHLEHRRRVHRVPRPRHAKSLRRTSRWRPLRTPIENKKIF
jgi:hypothetical protein